MSEIKIGTTVVPPTMPVMCQNCRWWNGSSVQCRRHAPTSERVRYAWPPIDNDPLQGTELVATWPKTRPNDWCGDFAQVGP